jgi:hypothetical protein
MMHAVQSEDESALGREEAVFEIRCSGGGHGTDFPNSRAVRLMAGGPAVIANHEARDVHRLEVRQGETG